MHGSSSSADMTGAASGASDDEAVESTLMVRLIHRSFSIGVVTSLSVCKI